MANNKRFTTFKAFKRWLWYNLHTGETLEGFQIWEDTIFKSYNIKKQKGGYRDWETDRKSVV